MTRSFRQFTGSSLLVLWLGSSQLLGQPLNDNFANRAPLTGMAVEVQGELSGATREAGEPFGGDPSIWWSWTAPESGAAQFAAEGAILTLYRGSSLAELVNLVSPFDQGLSGPVLLPVHAGDIVQISLGGYPYFSGPARLHIQSYVLPPAAVNDNFANRTLISPVAFQEDVVLASSSFEPGEPSPSFQLPRLPTSSGSLWWRYTAPSGGVLRAWVDTSNEVILGVYRGEDLASLQLVQHVRGEGILLPVSQGEVLQIGLAGPNLPLRSRSLFIQTLGAPANDNFAGSIPLEGASVTVSGRTLGATQQANEPAVSATSPGHTVWYSWAAPFTGRVRPGMSSVDPEVAVYTGPTLDRLARVPRTLFWPHDFLAIKDTIYHLQLDGNAGEDFVLSLAAQPLLPPPNDQFSNASRLRGGYHHVQVSLVGTSSEPGEPRHLGTTDAESVWWIWQAPANGTYYLGADDSLSAVSFAVYTGEVVEALTLLTKGPGPLLFSARGGTTYYIAGVAPAETVGDIALTLQGGPQDGVSLPVPGNLVRNASFEIFGDLSSWEYVNCGGTFHEGGAADGESWLAFGQGFELSDGTVVESGECWQDIPTVPGRTYRVRFAYGLYSSYGYPAPVRFRVTWDGNEIGEAAVSDPAMRYWNWMELTATATSSLTRLRFKNLESVAAMDAVSVVWLSEPASIVTPPSAVTAFAGATVSFLVGAQGTQPLSYQWFYNGAPLVGRTQATLRLEEITDANAGSYSVAVSNAFGSVSSASATLLVQTPKGPAILLQPFAETVPVGSYVALSVAAAGTPPLSYQWFLDGQEIPGATGRQLVIGSVQASDAGKYTVVVRNYSGSDTSLPAKLSIVDITSPGCVVRFHNYGPNLGPELNALIYDVDGVTKLAGSGYLAQLYAGAALESLRPCGEPTTFEVAFWAGQVVPELVTIPGVTQGSLAYAEIRAWEAPYGSYDEARALGGRYGRSPTHRAATDEWGFLAGLQGFRLRPGLSQFWVGELEVAEHRSDGTTIWRLRGEVGARYLIEKSDAAFNWAPLLMLDNAAGEVTFTDPTEGAHDSEFYRARIMD